MKNNNWQKNTKEQYNTTRAPKKQYDNEPTKFLPGKSVAVWNDDVNGALRKLKKVLERDDRQKDLARHEYYETPSAKRKRDKDAAKSRWRKEINNMRSNNTWVDPQTPSLKWMKTKRTRRAKSHLQETLKNLKGQKRAICE